MANRFWTSGAHDGDSGNVNNWSATRGGATGVSVPGNSDTAFFLDGDDDINANTAFAAGVVEIGGAFRGNINGLLCNYASCVVTIETVAPGKLVAIGPAAATTLATINVRSTGSGNVEIVGGAAGLLTNLVCGSTGRVTVQTNAPVTNCYSSGIFLQCWYNATAFTILQIEGGGSINTPHVIQRAVTTLTVSGAFTRADNSVAITTANLRGYHLHDSSGTIATANAFRAGTLQPGATPFIVTNSSWWEGGKLSYGNPKITFSNAPTTIGNVAA